MFKKIAVCCISAACIFAGYFLGISVLCQLLGAFFQSFGSLLIFTFAYIALTLVIEPAEKIMILAIRRLRLRQWTTVLASDITAVLFLWTAVFTADEFLDDIFLSTSAEIVIAVSFFTVDKMLYPRLVYKP
ncbi:YrvL family regulatory protein [Bacillus glycinifermentans]|uniref:YrvL family regulatory protein n=1 Tax=Bacillus glycinifermentans TaxID=1664069 RepID=UPI002DBE9A68|nr:YrvL family regulatory protein [Bacillus glycinifermentans]MEC3607650.1 YrvL family regulatory protein [Bacillus glycinifermentans]